MGSIEGCSFCSMGLILDGLEYLVPAASKGGTAILRASWMRYCCGSY